MDILSKCLQRYLIVWLVLISTLAFYWGRLASGESPATIDPFTASKPFLSGFIAVTMFAIGCMLPRDEVNQVLLRWPLVLGGTAVQYTVMPLLAILVGRLWQLQGDELVGVVVVGCVPGAMASNVLTLNARGNVSYSVSLTTVATLLSPIIVPVALRLTLVSTGMVSAAVVWRATILERPVAKYHNRTVRS